MNKRKYFIMVGLLSLFIFLLSSAAVKAKIPSNMVLVYDFDQQELSVSIIHIVGDPNSHYIESVQIRVKGSIITTELYTSQPTPGTFMYLYNTTANNGVTIQVSAICSVSCSISRTINVDISNGGLGPENLFSIIQECIDLNRVQTRKGRIKNKHNNIN